MGFITPAVAAIVGTIATVGTTAAQLAQATKDKRDRKNQKTADILAEAEARKKDQLLESRETRSQRKRASGSSQTTILGGSGTQAEIGRNVLLGQ